jgi:hypothetical protein
MAAVVPTLGDPDLGDLRRARELLESGSLVVRLAELLGHPVEKGLALLPGGAREKLDDVTRAALWKALRAALSTLAPGARRPAAERLHAIATATTGAVGGAFGIGGLAVELPVTTMLMFRSIAEIARSEGHDLSSAETRMQCLEVFALGGSSERDDAGETAYYAVRAGLATALADAARHLAERGVAREGAPVLVRAIAAIAARFGLVVQEKVLLSAVPVLGALSGSVVNTAFTRHFQARARGHFIVRRLEAAHGADVVKRLYEQIDNR